MLRANPLMAALAALTLALALGNLAQCGVTAAARASAKAQTRAANELRDDLAAAYAANERQADEALKRARAAQAYGSQTAAIDARLRATLERITDAPASRACVSSPALVAAVDGVRASRADAAALHDPRS